MARLERDIERSLRASEPSVRTRDSAGSLARRVQRTRLPASDDEPAATHHLRGRSFLALSDMYHEVVWDNHPRARRFFLKHRGFLPQHTRSDLPGFRQLYLRSALAASERAVELDPLSLECATLLVCVLWALCECSADEERRQWCFRLADAVEHALRHDVGQRHEVELSRLYGPSKTGAQSASERRVMLLDIKSRSSAMIHDVKPAAERLQAMLAEWVTKCALPEDELGEGACWTPWASPWRGVDLSLL